MDYVPTTGDSLSTDSQYFKYASIDSEGIIASNETKAMLYDVAAKAATVGIAVLILAAVAGVTAGVLILSGGNVLAAALAGALMLFIGYGIYRMCFEGVIPIEGSDQKYGIRHLKELSAQHQQLADTEKKIAERAQTLLVERKSSSPSAAKVMGRIQHWSELSMEKQKALEPLQVSIRETKEKILEKQHEGSDSSAEEKDLSSLLRDHYRVEVEELATSKILAAYTYHIFHNVDETRPLEEIIIAQPRSYATHRDLQNGQLPTPIASIPCQKRIITVEEIKEKSIQTLAQELFARTEMIA